MVGRYVSYYTPVLLRKCLVLKVVHQKNIKYHLLVCVFIWAVLCIGFIVTYFIFGDDEATLIELKPAIAVASLVVASIHTGFYQ
jgi:hypothetical protein